MYERAAASACGLAPLWHIGDGRSLFIGPLGHNVPHRHSAPVCLAGLYDDFRLRIGKSEWLSCHAAVIPAGTAYEFDMRSNPLSVLYIEPNVAGVDALTPLVRDSFEVNGALIGRACDVSLLREIYEDGSSAQWTGLALRDVVDFSKRRATRQIDQRISRVVELLQERYDERRSASQLAASVGLSASRFQHLFTRDIGVPFRRYRAWHRLRAAIREIVNGSNYTTAAHAAGFFDQAHFSRDFRRTFGAPVSPGLSQLRRNPCPTTTAL